MSADPVAMTRRTDPCPARARERRRTAREGARLSPRGLAPLALAIAAALGGCASVELPGLERLRSFEIPRNDPSFRSRIYAGAALGNSRLDPNTGGTVFSVDDPSALGTQLKLGVDVHNTLAFEIETGVLGEAKLGEAGAEVGYTSASVSALVYGLGGVAMRSRREGWSAFGRLGYGTLSKSSRVVPLDEDVAGAVLGIGGEYGFDNGLGIRGELTRYDSDAVFAGLGAIWRFGTPRETGAVLASAARTALGPVATTRVAADGRGLVGSGRTANRVEPRLGAARPHPEPVPGRRLPRRVTGTDRDADGVADARDACVGTAPGTSVDERGCGLFDAVLGDVVFKPGSWWLSPRARRALDDVAARLVAFPEVRVEVLAHTDATGPADLNLALSARRAEATVDYLGSRGVAELQLESRGLGETRPLGSNDSEAGRRRNRRVELVTLADLPLEVLAGRDIEGSVWHYPPSARARRTLEELPSAGAPSGAPARATPPARTEAVVEAAAAPAERATPPALGAARRASERERPAPLPEPGFLAGFPLSGVVEGLGFEAGRSRIADGAEADAALERVATALRRHPSVRVAVMAHTDATGDPEANRTLSRDRARAVVDGLVERGIDPGRLEAEGYGDSLPRVQAVTEADRAMNRRVELRVLR